LQVGMTIETSGVMVFYVYLPTELALLSCRRALAPAPG
jgi:hypothetical protein